MNNYLRFTVGPKSISKQELDLIKIDYNFPNFLNNHNQNSLMGKLKCKCCIQPKLRQLEKIIKKPHKYSKKYIEQIVDEEFIPELTKSFENLGICYPSSEILEIFDTVDMGKGVRAKEKLYKGQRLGCYMGEIKHNSEPSKDWRFNFAYVLKDFYIDGKDESLICYMNHSSKPNVKIIHRLRRRILGICQKTEYSSRRTPTFDNRIFHLKLTRFIAFVQNQIFFPPDCLIFHL